MENEVKEPAPKYDRFTAEEYLEMEREALDKHEYYQGEIFAMSGASIPHNFIFSNVFGDLCIKLKGKSCRPFGSDFRVHIPKNTLFTYPDITIVCGKEEVVDDDVSDNLLNPSVTIELLSKSTRNYDKGKKFTLYQDIDSFKEYILIDTEKVHVERYIRNADNSWSLSEYKNIEDSFTIATVNITVQLKDVYEGVSFA